MDLHGTVVEYVDAHGIAHAAIVTADWSTGNPDAAGKSLNVVYVTDDETMRDSYGRQIVRETSVVHESRQSAHGRYWRSKDVAAVA